MKRRDFLTATGALGACFCAGTVAMAQPAPSDNPEVNALRGKLDFMQKRIARLIAALDMRCT